MNKTYDLDENTESKIDNPDLVRDLTLLKKNNPSLPFIVRSQKLIFDSFIVGELRVGEHLIRIHPRSRSLTLGVIFEMAAYANMPSFRKAEKVPSFHYTSEFGISSVTDAFCNCIGNLLGYGITGKFVQNPLRSKTIRGRLLFENFHSANIVLYGLDMVVPDHSLNVLPNQVIKSALEKLLLIEPNYVLRGKITRLLRGFEAVERYSGRLSSIISELRTYRSVNPFYGIALEYGIMILNDLKLGYQDGRMEWYSFLENSNNLFEKYVRKVLETGLDADVQKWEEEKEFASITYKDRTGYKKFAPDILVDYLSDKAICRAVLDAKNKSFFPQKTPLNQIVSSSDIYQLMFYCRQLQSRLGALIYPTNEDFEPIRLNVNSESELRFFLLSINMNETFGNRYNKLLKDVETLLSHS